MCAFWPLLPIHVHSSSSAITDVFSQLDTASFHMTMLTLTLGAIGAAVTGLILANTDLFLSKCEKASLEFLEKTELKTLTKVARRTFRAEELWKTNGAVIMAVRRPGWFLCREEAAELSSLKPQLDKLGVPLYAVVKEDIKKEVEEFQSYFKGEIFLDERKRFYGPHKRTMKLLGFFRYSVWINFIRARKSGYHGNLDGEGFILGGVFVIGPGKQGILLEHREKEFGDKVNIDAVLEALKTINAQP